MKSLIVGFNYVTQPSGNSQEFLHIVNNDGSAEIRHQSNSLERPVFKTRFFEKGKWVPAQCLETKDILVTPLPDDFSELKISIH